MTYKITKRKAAELKSLVKTWAYHCKRCNYVWLPKDYEYGEEDDLTDRGGRPSACARCKSKYWADDRVNRNIMTISPEIREAMIPLSPLDKWVKEVVEEGRKDGLSDRTIAKTIRTYGRERNFTNHQISEALDRNGVKRYSRLLRSF